jgi:hypothetical protein
VHHADLRGIHHVVKPLTCAAAAASQSRELAVGGVEGVPEQQQQEHDHTQPPHGVHKDHQE